MAFAVWLVLGYLIGSIPFAFLVTYSVVSQDIRKLGTGNPGAANVARSVGKKWGILVWLADTLKGIVPMSLAANQGISHPILLTLIGLAAVAGHCWPVFLKFQGGKGAATSGGIVLYLMPKLFPLVIVLWFLVQKINPRSLKVIGQAVSIFFLFLYLIYQDQFLSLAISILLVILLNFLTNREIWRDVTL